MTSSSSQPPARAISVVFSRLGPYHLARLRGAAEVLAREKIGLTAIAIASMDKTYAWNRVDESSACPTRVLFPQAIYEEINEGQLERRLEACLDELNPVAVALPGWAFTEARAGLDWCRRMRRSAILMSESSQADHFRLWPREFLKQRLVRRFGAALVGGRRHEAYARVLGVPRAAIFFGYDAVDNDYFTRNARRVRADAEAIRRNHHLPARFFLSSSRFIAKKNIDGLLRAFALYLARKPDGRDLVICGDGEERDRLHKIAQGLHIEQRVHWPGFVQYPELPVYYALADAFILASTTEQWGLVVNEAMASELPVLVSARCGCAPDLIEEGRNGFTFDPQSEEAIAEAMLKLPDDPAQTARLGQASLEIINRWGPRAFGEGLLEAARIATARLGREDLTAGRNEA